MLARLCSIRLLACLLLAVPAATLPSLKSALAQAKDAEKEDETDEGGEGEDPNKPDTDQPLVTAGGNYSIPNTPLSEVQRTLLIPQGGLEARLLYNADLSKDVAFKTNTLTLFARYGLTRVAEIHGQFTFDASTPEGDMGTPGVPKTKILTAEGEAAIIYDLLDVRGGIDVDFTNSDTTIINIAAGLPFKYRFSDKLALIGLERILILHTKEKIPGKGTTPDLDLSLAGEFSPIPALSVILRATLVLSDSDSVDHKVPVDLTVQYAVANQFDIGLGVTLNNVAPPSSTDPITMMSIGPGAFDSRAIHLFVQGRL